MRQENERERYLSSVSANVTPKTPEVAGPRNAARMQYERFRQAAVPCGSGCVESAIRRVINLRLKAPGTFWTQDMAECFLFLRSQLLSGRWDTFIHNVARLTRQSIEPLPQLNNLEEPSELPQAA